MSKKSNKNESIHYASRDIRYCFGNLKVVSRKRIELSIKPADEPTHTDKNTPKSETENPEGTGSTAVALTHNKYIDKKGHKPLKSICNNFPVILNKNS